MNLKQVTKLYKGEKWKYVLKKSLYDLKKKQQIISVNK